MTAQAQAIRLHPEDNTATALVTLSSGEEALIREGEGSFTLAVREDIPFGHKVALAAIAAGEPIRKYGEVIGLARGAIVPGQLVHVHNVESQQRRGSTHGEG